MNTKDMTIIVTSRCKERMRAHTHTDKQHPYGNSL